MASSHVADLGPYTRHDGRRGREAFESRRPEATTALGTDTAPLMIRLIGQVAEAAEHLGYVVITARTE
ncbi:hypothetical protein ACIA6T_32030 [Streptomyces sp. NPDC051740]|uniref:hypothetical protein n=1 Tax=Streptomyces sp. NPDC051740 TaxID=3365673 RepID=UPI0037A5BEBD